MRFFNTPISVLIPVIFLATACGGSDDDGLPIASCRLTLIDFFETEFPSTSSISCKEGTFTVTNTGVPKGWHGLISRFDVPTDWTAVVEHEEYSEESGYTVPIPGTKGWVKLPNGRTNLDQFAGALYEDKELDVPTNTAVRLGGMNDAVRKIYLAPGSNDMLTIFKDSIGESPERITIKFTKAAGEQYPGF